MSNVFCIFPTFFRLGRFGECSPRLSPPSPPPPPRQTPRFPHKCRSPYLAHPGEIGGARHARRIALRAMRRKRRLSPPLPVVHGFAVNNGACRAPTGVAESVRTPSRQQPAKSSKCAERHSPRLSCRNLPIHRFLPHSVHSAQQIHKKTTTFVHIVPCNA